MDFSAHKRLISTPELLDRIFSYCSRREIAKLALVQKLWSELARDHIWRVVENPCELLPLLSPFVCPGDASEVNDHVCCAVMWLDELELTRR